MAKIYWAYDEEQKMNIGRLTPTPIGNVFCLGDNPKTAFFNGRWRPIAELRQFKNLYYYTLNYKPVKGFTAISDRKVFLAKAKRHEPLFSFLTFNK